jgi:hypothetical protein
MTELRMTGLVKAVEDWAAESDERVQLIVILIWASIGGMLLIGLGVAAWLLLPPEVFQR